MAEQSLDIRLRAQGARETVRALDDTSNAVRELDGAQRTSTRGVEEAQGGLSRFATGLRAAGPALAAVTAGLTAATIAMAGLVREALRAATEMQALERTLRGVAATEAEFVTLRQTVEDMTQSFGFARAETADILARVRATGLEAGESAQLFRGLALAGLSLGRTLDEIAGSAVAVSQSLNAGQIQAEELEQIAERGLVPVLTVLKDEFGITRKTAQDFQKAIEEAGLGAEDVWVAVGAILEERFGHLAEQLSGTLPAAIGRLQAAWEDLLTTIGQPGLQTAANLVDTLTGFIRNASDAFERWRPTIEAVSQLIANFVLVLNQAAGALRPFTELASRFMRGGQAAVERGRQLSQEAAQRAAGSIRGISPEQQQLIDRLREIGARVRTQSADKEAEKAREKQRRELEKQQKEAQRQAEQAARQAQRIAGEQARVREQMVRDRQRAEEEAARAQQRAQEEALRAAEDAARRQAEWVRQMARDRVTVAELLVREARLQDDTVEALGEILRLERNVIEQRRREAVIAGESPGLADLRARIENAELERQIAREKNDVLRREAEERDKDRRERLEATRADVNARLDGLRRVKDFMRNMLRLPDIGSAVLGLGGADVGEVLAQTRTPARNPALARAMELRFIAILEERDHQILEALDRMARSSRRTF